MSTTSAETSKDKGKKIPPRLDKSNKYKDAVDVGDIAVNTNLSVILKQAKILELFREKAKDTISAQDYIRQMDDSVVTTNWTKMQDSKHFAFALRGQARDWLHSIFPIG
jgi:hypothetical protein